MSEIKVSKLTNRAGTGAPDFSQGVKISGTTSTLLAPTRTEGATEPTTPANGDTWYDTANDTYDVYINDEWKRFIGEASSYDWVADVSNFSYDSKSFDVNSQESTPQGIAISSDGTKLYITGQAQDKIFQYTMSTAYDVSTASYDNVSYSVSSQDTAPQSVKFSTDGTKMYMMSNSNPSCYEYDLSTAWDVSSASYNNVNFNIGTASGDNTFNGHCWSPYGTEVYFTANGNDKIYQVDCSTAFDLSTASYNNKYFDVSSQSNSLFAVACSGDGTKFYIVDVILDTIFQYSASTAFDVTTLSYDNSSFSISSQVGAGQDMAFSIDGTKLYFMNSLDDKVYQYSTGL